MKMFNFAAYTLVLLGIGSVHMLPAAPLGVSLDSWRYRAVNWRGDIMGAMKTAIKAYESGLITLIGQNAAAPGKEARPDAANIVQLVDGFKEISKSLEKRFTDISALISRESVLSEPTVEEFLAKFREFVVIFKTGVKEFGNTWDETVKELEKIEAVEKDKMKVDNETILLGLDIELGREGVKLIHTMLNDTNKEWDQAIDANVQLKPYTDIYEKINQLKTKADQASQGISGTRIPDIEVAKTNAKNIQAYVEEAFNIFKEYRALLLKRYEEKKVKVKAEYLDNIEHYMSMVALQPKSVVIPEEFRSKMTEPTESGAVSFRHALSVSAGAAITLAAVAIYAA